MSHHFSPKITTSGLVMCLDAASRKSYSGSGVTWKDLSGTNNNATLVNGITYTSNNLGALTLNGTNQYCDLGFGLTTNFSIDAVIKTTNAAKKQSVISNYSSANDGAGLEVLATGALNFFVFLSGVVSGFTTGAGVVANNSFYNVVCIKSGTSYSMYSNGSFLGSTTGGASITQSQNLRMGADRSNTPTNFYEGNLFSMKVYNRGLSASEVSQNFNAHRGRFGV